MLHKFEVSGIHTNLDEKTQKYVNKKIGTLDRYIPKHARDSAHIEVHLKRQKTGSDKFSCNITLYLPHQIIAANENASSFEAAIDSVESKLKHQIKKYKELHSSGKARRHLAGRLVRVG
jgi:putative sigma-54 modulation protein